jgi:hypothetical protein
MFATWAKRGRSGGARNATGPAIAANGLQAAQNVRKPANLPHGLVAAQNGRKAEKELRNTRSALNGVTSMATGEKAPASAPNPLVGEQNGTNPPNADPGLNSVIAAGPSADKGKTHADAADHADPGTLAIARRIW